MNFRKLNANEIDARVANVSEKGISLLLYKDARVDQKLLDETVGPMNWQRSHQIIGDRLYCTVSIYDEDRGVWVSKQDVGTESNTEAEKGQASDSFKRACFNWGIGRELYSAPFVWVPADRCNISDGKNGKKACYDSFTVKYIGYDESGNINALSIINTKTGATVYAMGSKEAPGAKPEEKPKKTAPKTPPRMINETEIATIYNNAKIKNISVPSMLKYYGVSNIKALTSEQAQEAIKKLMNMGAPDESTGRNLNGNAV